MQKYEKGENRISASSLRRIAEMLQVPVEFFFEGAPHVRGRPSTEAGAAISQYVSDYLATSDGLHLTKAYMQIANAKIRRSIVNLVEAIAGPEIP